jgi:hypothetical protein
MYAHFLRPFVGPPFLSPMLYILPWHADNGQKHGTEAVKNTEISCSKRGTAFPSF